MSTGAPRMTGRYGSGGPFEETARTVDVRRANSPRKQGGWTPAGVGLFVWRLKPYALTSSPRRAGRPRSA